MSLSPENKALIERLLGRCAISSQTADYLVDHWGQANILLNAARSDPKPPVEGGGGEGMGSSGGSDAHIEVRPDGLHSAGQDDQAAPSALTTILDWYRGLPNRARESLSLAHLHGLAKRLTGSTSALKHVEPGWLDRSIAERSSSATSSRSRPSTVNVATNRAETLAEECRASAGLIDKFGLESDDSTADLLREVADFLTNQPAQAGDAAQVHHAFREAINPSSHSLHGIKKEEGE